VDFATGALMPKDKYDANSAAVKGGHVMLVRAKLPGEVVP